MTTFYYRSHPLEDTILIAHEIAGWSAAHTITESQNMTGADVPANLCPMNVKSWVMNRLCQAMKKKSQDRSTNAHCCASRQELSDFRTTIARPKTRSWRASYTSCTVFQYKTLPTLPSIHDVQIASLTRWWASPKQSPGGAHFPLLTCTKPHCQHQHCYSSSGAHTLQHQPWLQFPRPQTQVLLHPSSAQHCDPMHAHSAWPKTTSSTSAPM